MDSNSDSILGLRNDCPYIIDNNLDIVDDQMIENFFVMHLNVRSFMKNSDNFKLLLDDLLCNNVTIDVILLCETWTNNNNIQLIGIPGYQCFNKNRETRQGGGILIFVRNHIRVLEIFQTPFNETTESLFIRITHGKNSLVFGEVYRIPNTSVKDFQKDYREILNRLSKEKNVIIGSDHNLDLLKAKLHQPTEIFIEDLAVAGYISTISKPTRLTHQSSTLIDNIFIKGACSLGFKSYVLVDDISDHYPCLFQIENPSKKYVNDIVISKRKVTDSTIQKLNQKLLFHDWNVIYGMDTNRSYKYLVSIITSYLDELAPIHVIYSW